VTAARKTARSLLKKKPTEFDNEESGTSVPKLKKNSIKTILHP